MASAVAHSNSAWNKDWRVVSSFYLLFTAGAKWILLTLPDYCILHIWSRTPSKNGVIWYYQIGLGLCQKSCPCQVLQLCRSNHFAPPLKEKNLNNPLCVRCCENWFGCASKRNSILICKVKELIHSQVMFVRNQVQFKGNANHFEI